MSKKGPRERFVYVLDYLRNGNPVDKHQWHKNKPLVQVVGQDFFILMEAIPLREPFQIEEKIDRDKDPPRIKVDVLIEYDDLTSVAKDTLNRVIAKIVEEKEKEFVAFFNKAEPLTLKLHTLELLPDIGKKTLRVILEQRRESPFMTYQDIQNRVGIKDVKEIIIKRILTEMKREDKYYLFVYPTETEQKTQESKQRMQEQTQDSKQKQEHIYIGYLDKVKEK
ncbi:DUF655 domain-containing protein [Metallosphaera tengchongensis]|uniref:DUF655 domain-containing protein n=1 Tax=Metallosphaera tengchongensis TaxID=1532350 RepID=A0A6N0NT24_9CREN|nr:DUF655 domain-containing protein [Metallosphaera tengchongensis]QKQ99895.1 DUF655 domain-containing protein [Metallosphaera tengchongensis]